jgi:PAS domain S-box-containing protein
MRVSRRWPLNRYGGSDVTQPQRSDPNVRSNAAGRENFKGSERERAEEGLALEVLNNAGNLIVLKDTEGRYLFVNRQFERTFHVRQAEIRGKKDEEIFPPEQAAAFRANDLEVIQAGVPMEFEEAILHDDGPHPSIVQKFPLINTNGRVYATASIVSDITERKRAEQALRESEEHYRLLCETATDAVISINENGQMEFVDPATASAREALVRADVGVAFATEDGLQVILQACAESMVRHFDAALARIWTVDKDHSVLELQASAGIHADLDGTYSRVPVGLFEIGLIAKEQKPLLIDNVLNDPRVLDAVWARNQGTVAFAGYPLLVRESLVGVMAIFSKNSVSTKTLDALASIALAIAKGITQKRAEKAWQSTQAELARVARLTTMSALSASIAHEVTQPLAAIVTNGDACLRLLESDSPNLAETREAVTSIIRDARRAADVVAHVRALLKKSDVERTTLDLGQLIRDVLALVQPAVATHRIVVRVSLSDDLPPVRGDRIQLQQVLLNLLTNAIEALRDVVDRRRDLVISSRRQDIGPDAGVVVSLEDSGVGFDRVNVNQLFEALYTTKPYGLGMGLSISQSIILDHAGRLWATPNARYGASFQFFLPAWKGQNP